jgi:hypothetical protein
MAMKKGKKQDVNEEVAEAKNSFSSLSLLFYTSSLFFSRAFGAFFGSYGSTTTSRLHPLKNRKKKKRKDTTSSPLLRS